MMATGKRAHVESSVELLGDDAEPQYDDSSDQGDCDGESDSSGSDDGGENSRDGGSNEDEAEDEDNGIDEEGEESNPNAGWAEAMAKILGKKTPGSKPTILLKNKDLDKTKEKEKQEKLEIKKQIDKKRAWEMMCREKPDLVKNREAEKNLQRTATRGVVQLFNAVKKHQKTMDEKVKDVGGSERKKAKLLSTVSKKDFIDVLRRTEGGSNVAIKSENNTEEKPSWSVLRDDFMMGASMKDWDKESGGEEGPPETQGGVEDSDSD
ncbi:RRP15-like protein [Polymixia lowei]